MAGNQYTLKSLARELEPEAFEEWEAAKGEAVSAMLRGDYTSTRQAPIPAAVRIVKRGDYRAASAPSKLQRCIKDAIASPKYRAQGTCPDTIRRAIPRNVASHILHADLDKNTLRTDGYVWRNVMVKRLGKRAAELRLTSGMVKWYRDRAASWKGRPPSGPDDERDFKHEFRNQGDARGFSRELRRLHAPPDWHKDGPKVPNPKARKPRKARAA